MWALELDSSTNGYPCQELELDSPANECLGRSHNTPKTEF